MPAEPLVSALEEPWRAILDAVLRRLGAPALADVARLGPRVAELSRAYNQGRAGDAPERVATPLEARVAFSFARDVPKGGAAVAELVAAGLVASREPGTLRLLDLGAGLGAMTWGIARALAAAGQRSAIDAHFVDADRAALGAAAAIHEAVRAAGAGAPFGLGDVAVSVRTREGRFEGGRLPPLPGGRFDLVVLGQVLSELDTTLEPEARASRHADILRALLADVVDEGGSLVVVEPALRERARHLHAVRDRLVLGEAPPILFAPCLHASFCPVLLAEGDWCHEDRGVDLPPWLVPLARAAGLRFQGLTFSYLVLRRRGPTLRELVAARISVPGERVHLRVVSDRMPSKGKVELFACTESGARVRLRRLDRDTAEANAAFDELGRGDVVTLAGAPEPDGARSPFDERGRLGQHAGVLVHAARRPQRS